MRRIIYVAGPMAKPPMDDNIRRAMSAGAALIGLGFTPILPQLSFYMAVHYPQSWETWLDVDKPLVLKSDGVLRLDGESKGADLEEQWARDADIPVFYAVSEVAEYFRPSTVYDAIDNMYRRVGQQDDEAIDGWAWAGHVPEGHRGAK